MNLDLFDVREGCADLFGKVKAFAECTGMVRGREAFEFGAVLFNHGVVCTEAACGQHDRLGVDGFGSLCRLDLDAGDRAVLHQNVDDLMVLEDFDLVGLESGGQNAKNFRPDGGAVAGAVTARNGLTATAALAEAELGAEIDKPFLRISCVFRERLQERGIVEVVTAFHRVLIEDFRTVVRDAACDLLLRARCVHASRGEVGVAADVGHLFEDDDARAGLLGHDGGGETCTARADNDDVKGLGERNGCEESEHGARNKGFSVHIYPLPERKKMDSLKTYLLKGVNVIGINSYGVFRAK